MALDAAALRGEGDVHQHLPLQQSREHGAEVGQMVVPPEAVVLGARQVHPVGKVIQYMCCNISRYLSVPEGRYSLPKAQMRRGT
jgi:hypothetical protein